MFFTITVFNSLDPDQAQHFDEPDLNLKGLQRLKADKLAGRELKV